MTVVDDIYGDGYGGGFGYGGGGGFGYGGGFGDGDGGGFGYGGYGGGGDFGYGGVYGESFAVQMDELRAAVVMSLESITAAPHTQDNHPVGD